MHLIKGSRSGHQQGGRMFKHKAAFMLLPVLAIPAQAEATYLVEALAGVEARF